MLPAYRGGKSIRKRSANVLSRNRIGSVLIDWETAARSTLVFDSGCSRYSK